VQQAVEDCLRQDQLQAALSKINFGNVAGLLTGLLAGLAGVFSNMLLLLFVVAFMALDSVGFSSRQSRARRERPEVIGSLENFALVPGPTCWSRRYSG
jgi:predicted PurR-regulated permease PerM